VFLQVLEVPSGKLSLQEADEATLATIGREQRLQDRQNVTDFVSAGIHHVQCDLLDLVQ